MRSAGEPGFLNPERFLAAARNHGHTVRRAIPTLLLSESQGWAGLLFAIGNCTVGAKGHVGFVLQEYIKIRNRGTSQYLFSSYFAPTS